MKKIIFSLGLIVAAAALVVGSTSAFLSDTESSKGNVFAAGEIDLGIDNESYYNGVLNPGTSWDLDFDLDDLDTPRLFFNFLDLKPDDEGEDTISLHVKDNDAWACLEIALTAKDDNGLTEPEAGDGDTTGGLGEGELQNEINFVWWADDGDNVLETDETDNIFKTSTLNDLDGFKVPLADSTGQGILSAGPLLGSQTYYIGKAWCYGTLAVNAVAQDGDGKTGSNGPLVRGTGITCDGTGLNNITQTDSVKGDISFIATQSRHDQVFKCEGGAPGCEDKPDVMLVLDRSGSISAGELTQLKTAANAFVTALAPSTDGAHIGQSSFSTTGTLDQPLTDSAASITAAINGLATGGLTNLFDGITLATTELTGANDRNDATSPDFMVIITDGNPNEPGSDANAESVAATAADAARAAGIDVYVVGVGGDVDTAYLINNIADDPAHYFAAADYASLAAALQAIANCEEPPAITGTLTINKVVINDSGTGESTSSSFHFFANGIELMNGVPLNLPSGTYAITETPVNPIYSTTFSGDCNASGTVTLGVGQSKTCTITNDDKAPQALFSFNFGTSTSDTQDIGGATWDESGTDSSNSTIARAFQVSGEDVVSPDGGQFAKIAAGEWLCREVNASNFSSLALKYYWRGDADAEDGESGIIEYRASGSCTSVGSWTTLASHELDDGNAGTPSWSSLQTANLPGSLNGDSSFFIRFRNAANDGAEFFRIDGVSMTGLPN